MINSLRENEFMANKLNPVTALATTVTNAAKQLVGIPVTIDDLARRVAEIEEEGGKLCAHADRLEDQLEVLTDEDEILRAMAGAKAARNRADVLARDLEVARDRLATARDADRVRRRDEAVANYREMLLGWLAKAHELELAARPIIAAREAFMIHGFNLEYAAAPRVPMIGQGLHFSEEVLHRVRAEVSQFGAAEHVLHSSIGRSDRALAAADRAIFQRVEDEQAAKAPKLKAVPTPEKPRTKSAPRPKPRPLLREVAGEGQRLIVVLRSGLELPGREALRMGDIVAVSPDHGIQLINHTAADWVTESDRDAAIASNPPADTNGEFA